MQSFSHNTEEANRIGIGYNVLNDSCFFTQNGKLMHQMKKVKFPANMYFSVCFYHKDDMVRIRFNNIKFDIKKYSDSNVKLPIDAKSVDLPKKYMKELVYEYLQDSAYVNTLQALDNDKSISLGKRTEPKRVSRLVDLSIVRKALKGNNNLIAWILIKKRWPTFLKRELIPIKTIIYTLQFLYLIRSKRFDQAHKFVREKLRSLKDQKIVFCKQSQTRTDFETSLPCKIILSL